MARILLNAVSAHIRLILRIYFNVVLPLLGFIGDQCCKKSAELTLLKGQALKITHTTGWLRGASVAYMMYSFRRSPVGWLGFGMLTCSAFWLVSDLIVSGFVVTVSVVDRCPFNTSMPYTALEHANDTKVGPFAPSNIGALWDLVTRATITSQQNGGLVGIFYKVNSEPTFRADEKDVIGAWHCDVAGEDQTYEAREDPEQLGQDLISKGLLYGNWTACATEFIGHNWYLQYAAWSPSVGDWSEELQGLTPDEIIDSPVLYPWDVRAVLDMEPKVSEPKIIRPFHCTWDTKALDFVLGKVQATTTLSTFCNTMRSNVYRYFGEDIPMVVDPGAAIALTLDSISMMAAAAQDGWYVPPPKIDDLYQGCLAARTQIPEEVIIVWVLVTSAVVAVGLYWLVLTIRIHRFKRHNQSYVKFLAEAISNGLFGWMRQSVRMNESVEASNINYDALSAWKLSPSASRQSLDLQRISTSEGLHEGGGYHAYYPLENRFPHRVGSKDRGPYIRIRERR